MKRQDPMEPVVERLTDGASIQVHHNTWAVFPSFEAATACLEGLEIWGEDEESSESHSFEAFWKARVECFGGVAIEDQEECASPWTWAKAKEQNFLERLTQGACPLIVVETSPDEVRFYTQTCELALIGEAGKRLKKAAYQSPGTLVLPTREQAQAALRVYLARQGTSLQELAVFFGGFLPWGSQAQDKSYGELATLEAARRILQADQARSEACEAAQEEEDVRRYQEKLNSPETEEARKARRAKENEARVQASKKRAEERKLQGIQAFIADEAGEIVSLQEVEAWLQARREAQRSEAEKAKERDEHDARHRVWVQDRERKARQENEAAGREQTRHRKDAQEKTQAASSEEADVEAEAQHSGRTSDESGGGGDEQG